MLSETDLLEIGTRNGACSASRPPACTRRDKLSIYEKARMDAFYANNLSLSLDMRILIASVWYVLSSTDIQEGSAAWEEKKYKKERTA